MRVENVKHLQATLCQCLRYTVESNLPVLVTSDGRPIAVIVSAAEFWGEQVTDEEIREQLIALGYSAEQQETYRGNGI